MFDYIVLFFFMESVFVILDEKIDIFEEVIVLNKVSGVYLGSKCKQILIYFGVMCFLEIVILDEFVVMLYVCYIDVWYIMLICVEYMVNRFGYDFQWYVVGVLFFCNIQWLVVYKDMELDLKICLVVVVVKVWRDLKYW